MAAMRTKIRKLVWSRLKAFIAVVGGVVAFTAATAGVLQYLKSNPSVDITGTWELSLVVEETTYSPFRGMEVDYLLFLQQDGTSITGRGEKWAVNGEELPSSQHDPIDLRGTISGGSLDLVFNVFGARRQSAGHLRLELSDDQAAGDFRWTAAASSGPASAERLQRRRQQPDTHPAISRGAQRSD